MNLWRDSTAALLTGTKHNLSSFPAEVNNYQTPVGARQKAVGFSPDVAMVSGLSSPARSGSEAPFASPLSHLKVSCMF